MAGLTLADARTLVGQFLDDPNNRRWTSAQVDAALQHALTSCLSDYVSDGGSQFDVELAISTASTGVADLTSIAPILKIVSVQTLYGTTQFESVLECRPQDRGWLEQAVYALRVIYVRDYVLPTTTTHNIVGIGAASAPSWFAFDRWVCAEAARQLGIKDAEQRAGLEALAGEARRSVLDRQNSPRTYPLPVPQTSRAAFRRLSYLFTPDMTAPSLRLVRARGDW
jgi:hypothetical protein